MVRVPSDSSAIPHERVGVDPDTHSFSFHPCTRRPLKAPAGEASNPASSCPAHEPVSGRVPIMPGRQGDFTDAGRSIALYMLLRICLLDLFFDFDSIIMVFHVK